MIGTIAVITPRPGAPRRRVLLVEDNPADARLAVEAFGEVAWSGCIEHVADGDRALALLRERAETGRGLPDLVLLDLNLPGRHGRELLAAMRADPVLATVPVVVFTTSTAAEEVEACYRLGANCYVAKPVELGELQRVAEAIVRFWFATVELPPRDGVPAAKSKRVGAGSTSSSPAGPTS